MTDIIDTHTDAEYDAQQLPEGGLPAHIASLSAFKQEDGAYHLDGCMPTHVALRIAAVPGVRVRTIEAFWQSDGLKCFVDGYASLEAAEQVVALCVRHNAEVSR